MATIKSFSDLEQSKKLAEILPIESADMCYLSENGQAKTISPSKLSEILNVSKPQVIPCWSLAALLDIFPKEEGIECSISFGYYNGKGEYIEKWLCAFEKEGETTNDFIIETFNGDNPVDACYEMILKLHELNLF